MSWQKCNINMQLVQSRRSYFSESKEKKIEMLFCQLQNKTKLQRERNRGGTDKRVGTALKLCYENIRDQDARGQ